MNLIIILILIKETNFFVVTFVDVVHNSMVCIKNKTVFEMAVSLLEEKENPTNRTMKHRITNEQINLFVAEKIVISS